MADKQTESRRRDKPTTPGLPIWAIGVLVMGALLVIGLAPGCVFTPPAPAPTPTPEPTLTPEPTVAIDPTTLSLALEGVTTNGEWTPYMREFHGVQMALVPAGCFMMGSEDGYGEEQPVHEVCFHEPFWIDVYEVTNGQYGAASEGCIEYSSEDDQPRVCIDWFEAVAHCESRGERLPTEAEWEYSARGPDGLIYPWGDEFNCRLGNFDDETRYSSYIIEGRKGCDGFIATAPVGSFPDGASWVGALDMSGNVEEWVADWHDYGYYDRSPRDNPGGPDSGETRVLRGGSWFDFDANFLRAAFRPFAFPVGRSDYFGVRCALSY